MEKDIENILKRALPAEAVDTHPTKTYLSVIRPMYVIDVLNEAFGIGAWQFTTEPVNFVGKFAVVKGTLKVPKLDIHIEQYGGNDNADVGDAYKGAATDALTKCASYLGVGASIYKGQGNIGGITWTVETACAELAKAATLDELKATFLSFPPNIKSDLEVTAKKDELKNKLA